MTAADPLDVPRGVGAREACAAARRWLRALADGPRPDGGPDGRSGATLAEADADLRFEAGVAHGTIALATGLALAGADIVAEATGSPLAVDEAAVRAVLYLPLLLGGADAHPPPPVRAFRGMVCADLGAEGDRDAFGRLLLTMPRPLARPEELASRAQEWRLPVTPYRRMRRVERLDRPTRGSAAPVALDLVAGDDGRPDSAAPAAPGPVEGPGAADPPLKGTRVVDLTIMWAGPLATWLLAGLGAEIVKVEPACRQDGMRASPGLFEALNRGKRRMDLDLRRPEARARFFDLVAGADLVIDNFSPRVGPNLGIEPAALRRVNPQVCSLSMPAFPLGSDERDWVAYGTGVHAISGLGDAGPKGFAAPTVTYPDALAGFTAFAMAVALLTHRERGPGRVPAGSPTNHAEVTLRGAVEPLRAIHDLGATLLRPVPAAGLHSLGRTVLDDAGLPPCPFRGPGLPVDLAPAPGWS